jgi:hypothetical protein
MTRRQKDAFRRQAHTSRTTKKQFQISNFQSQIKSRVSTLGRRTMAGAHFNHGWHGYFKMAAGIGRPAAKKTPSVAKRAFHEQQKNNFRFPISNLKSKAACPYWAGGRWQASF